MERLGLAGVDISPMNGFDSRLVGLTGGNSNGLEAPLEATVGESNSNGLVVVPTWAGLGGESAPWFDMRIGRMRSLWFSWREEVGKEKGLSLSTHACLKWPKHSRVHTFSTVIKGGNNLGPIYFNFQHLNSHLLFGLRKTSLKPFSILILGRVVRLPYS